MSFLVERPPEQYDRAAFSGFNTSDTFNLGTARAMMWMSQLAYETHVPATIASVSKLLQLSEVRVLSKPAVSTLPMTDTRGVIVKRDDATIVAFAGTDPLHLLNWVSDFTLGRPQAAVHQGFRDAAAAVWNDAKGALAAARDSGSPVFITGHSLGAAIAVVTADFARRELQLGNAQIYLFGCPRVGRADFVAPYNITFGATSYRLVHGADIVPTVPPPLLGFHHVGGYLGCASGSKFSADTAKPAFGSDEPEADAGVGERLRNLFLGFSENARRDTLGDLSVVLPPGIGDHLPDRYCAALTPAQ
ncbi:lipase family protein [Bradyrhizobium sp. UFLA05-112]